MGSHTESSMYVPVGDKENERKKIHFYGFLRRQLFSKRGLFRGIILVSCVVLTVARIGHLWFFAVSLFSSQASGDSIITIPHCPENSSTIRNVITLDLKKIKAHHPNEKLVKLNNLSHSIFFVQAPGNQHYTLLEYLTENFGDCRSVVDVGIGSVFSALALGAGGTLVRSYNVLNKKHDDDAAAKQQKQQLDVSANKTVNDSEKNQFIDAGLKIQFFQEDLLTMVQQLFIEHFNSTWLILLDTLQMPWSQPFEREFVNRLREISYRGIVLVDDIHGPGTVGAETERWWYEILDRSKYANFTCYDLTKVGHFSGTGLIDFSGMVKVIK